MRTHYLRIFSLSCLFIALGFYTVVNAFSQGDRLAGEFFAGLVFLLVLAAIILFIADFKIIRDSFSSKSDIEHS